MELNKLKNEVVYHGVYGKGIVESVGENIIEVFFDNIDKSCKFSYPSCFRKFLVIEDNKLKEEIEKDIDEWLISSGTLKREATERKIIATREGIQEREKQRKIARIKKAQAEAQRSRFFAGLSNAASGKDGGEKTTKQSEE